eukprot:CAMPEP_0184492546 /NCGR_PEP_ID=MMETSP0113_2-20130426/23594_1 /TAXON_ID=91329 /ORGANISM="Norrisiella sphaerica, Strain BC52" /LENGTH=86 /DNA_ID=CAMNT_0026877405 /DNA_START=25 /DNA_END=286 /DNA_ORIENTATION=-
MDNVDYSLGEGEAPPGSIEDGTYHSKAYVDQHVANLMREQNRKRLSLEEFKKKRAKDFEEIFGGSELDEKKEESTENNWMQKGKRN